MFRLGTLSERLSPRQRARRTERIARRRYGAHARDPLAHVVHIPRADKKPDLLDGLIKKASEIYNKIRKAGAPDKVAFRIAQRQMQLDKALANVKKVKTCGFQQPRGILGSFRRKTLACDGTLKKSRAYPSGEIVYTCKKCGRVRM